MTLVAGQMLAMGLVGQQLAAQQSKGPILVTLMIGDPLGGGRDYFIEKGTSFSAKVQASEAAKGAGWATDFTVVDALVGQPGGREVIPAGTRITSSNRGLIMVNPDGRKVLCRSFFTMKSDNGGKGLITLEVFEGGLISGLFVDGDAKPKMDFVPIAAPASAKASPAEFPLLALPTQIAPVGTSKGATRASHTFIRKDAERFAMVIHSIDDPDVPGEKVDSLELLSDFRNDQGQLVFPKGTVLLPRKGLCLTTSPTGEKTTVAKFFDYEPARKRVLLIEGAQVPMPERR